FPRGLTSNRDLERHRFDFSFSGLKTAVARWVEARRRDGAPVPVNDVAAAFQEAVCDVLTRKALDACGERGYEHLLIGGGGGGKPRARAGGAGRGGRGRDRCPGPASGPVYRQRCDGRRARVGAGAGWGGAVTAGS